MRGRWTQKPFLGSKEGTRASAVVGGDPCLQKCLWRRIVSSWRCQKTHISSRKTRIRSQKMWTSIDAESRLPRLLELTPPAVSSTSSITNVFGPSTDKGLALLKILQAGASRCLLVRTCVCHNGRHVLTTENVSWRGTMTPQFVQNLITFPTIPTSPSVILYSSYALLPINKSYKIATES